MAACSGLISFLRVHVAATSVDTRLVASNAHPSRRDRQGCVSVSVCVCGGVNQVILWQNGDMHVHGKLADGRTIDYHLAAPSAQVRHGTQTGPHANLPQFQLGFLASHGSAFHAGIRASFFLSPAPTLPLSQNLGFHP